MHYFNIRMNIVAMIITFCSTICFSGTGNEDLKKISKADVGAKLIKSTNAFLNDFFEKAEKGEYYDFSSVATEAVVNGLTPAIQQQVHSELEKTAGEYKGAIYKEAFAQGSEYKILRFMGKFSKGVPIELRVVYDKNEKIAGYWAVPWKDNLQL